VRAGAVCYSRALCVVEEEVEFMREDLGEGDLPVSFFAWYAPAEGATSHARAFLLKYLHQPWELMLPSTVVQEWRGRNMVHSSHFLPSFGDHW